MLSGAYNRGRVVPNLHKLLQWVVGLYQQWHRLFACTAYCAQTYSASPGYSVSLRFSVHSHISKTTGPDLMQFSVRLTCGRGSVIF